MHGGCELFASAFATAASLLTPKPAACDGGADLERGLERLEQRLGGVEAFLGPAASVPFKPVATAASSQKAALANASTSKDAADTSASQAVRVPQEKKSSAFTGALHRFAAAGIGAGVAEAMTLPIDIAKVRLQTQVPLADGSLAYKGMLQGMGLVAQTEGPAALSVGPSIRMPKDTFPNRIYYSFNFGNGFKGV